MTGPLTDETLAAIALRDNVAGGGPVTLDNLAAQDRHVLLLEVHRLQKIVTRLRTGRPIA